MLVGSLPVLYVDASTGAPGVRFLDVPPPAPFRSEDLGQMWDTVVQSEVPTPDSILAQGRAGGAGEAIGRGLDSEAVPAAVGALARLARRWPIHDETELIWRPLELRGGREDLRATDRLGARLAGARRSDGTPVPDRVARRRRSTTQWKSRSLSSACVALARAIQENALDAERAERTLALVERVARTAAPPGRETDRSVSSWPHPAQVAYRAVIRALLFLGISGSGGDRVPLCRLWRLYEAWVTTVCATALEERLGAGSAVRSRWFTREWSIAKAVSLRFHAQATIANYSDLSIYGRGPGVLSVTSELRPDAAIAVANRLNDKQVLLAIDAKQRNVFMRMDPSAVAEAASKYAWGVRRADDVDAIAIARTLVVSSAPVPEMYDLDLSRIDAAFLLPSSDQTEFVDKLNAALDVAVRSVRLDETRSAMRSAAASGQSCSQTRTTAQSASASSASVSRSRTTLRASFSAHRCRLFFGFEPCSGQLCQKQPSTKTAIRARGKTMSARRRDFVRTGTSIRNRSPRRWSAERSLVSGSVSRRDTAFIRFDVAGAVDGHRFLLRGTGERRWFCGVDVFVEAVQKAVSEP